MALTTGNQGERDANASSYSYQVYGPAPGNGHDRGDGAHTGPVTDATFAELIGRIVNNFSDLVDRQIDLAKQEIREDLGEVAGAAKKLGIGAGIAAAAGLLLVIWLWTGFIWFFNWLGEKIFGIWGLGAWGASLGWLLGLLVPLIAAFVAWKMFIQPGIQQVKIRPLERTRATLKEDLEWAKSLRTPSAR